MEVKLRHTAPPKLQEAKFYTLILKTPDDRIFTYQAVHYSQEEAEARADEMIRDKQAAIYAAARHRGGIQIISRITHTAQRLEEAFKTAAEGAIADNAKTKNDLMQHIVTFKDVAALHANATLFTKEEIAYMHDSITKTPHG